MEDKTSFRIADHYKGVFSDVEVCGHSSKDDSVWLEWITNNFRRNQWARSYRLYQSASRLTEAGRKKLSDLMKRRWAAKKRPPHKLVWGSRSVGPDRDHDERCPCRAATPMPSSSGRSMELY